MANRLHLAAVAQLLSSAWSSRPRVGIAEEVAFIQRHQEYPHLEQGVCLNDFGEGRFANQVLLLTSALEAAQHLGVKFLRLPREDNSTITTIRKVLRLEDDVWHIGTTPAATSAHLEVECAAECSFYWFKSNCRWPNGTDLNLKRTAEPTLLRQLLTDTGRLRCNEADFFHSDSSTLTMHMRAGDVLKMPFQASGYHKLAPCEFWTQSMKHGNYTSALIVTEPAEPGQQHPCISVVQEAFPGRVKMQSQGLLEDFCAVMHSHSLAVSFSTIGSVLVELSPNLRHVYAPSWCWNMVVDRSNLLEKCVEMTFAGYPERFESWPQKRDYLLSFPADGVSTEEKPCASP